MTKSSFIHSLVGPDPFIRKGCKTITSQDTAYRSISLSTKYILISIIFLLICALSFDKTFPLPQFSNYNDVRYLYPYLKETFSSTLCFLIGGVLPLGLLVAPAMLATLYVTDQRPKLRTFCDMIVSLPQVISTNAFLSAFAGSLSAYYSMGLLLSLALSTFLVTVLKTYIGRPRPNAVSMSLRYYESTKKLDQMKALSQCIDTGMCLPLNSPLSYTSDYLTPSLSLSPNASFNPINNSMSNHLINEALRSFPSGHSAFAFAGFIFFMMVIVSRYLRIFKLAKLTQTAHTAVHRRRVCDDDSESDLHLYPDLILQTKSEVSFNALLQPFLPMFTHVPYHVCHHNETNPFGNYGACFDENDFTQNDDRLDHTESSDTDDIDDANDINSPSATLKGNSIITDNVNSGELVLQTIGVLPLYLALVAYVVIPLLIPSIIASSRVVDYWHHTDDVFAGAVLGGFCAMLSYVLVVGK